MVNKDIKMDQLNSIIGVGNPIIDITAELDEQTFNRYFTNNKISPGNFIIPSGNNNEFIKDLENMVKVKHTPGGSVMNTLRICSQILHSNEQNSKYKLSMLGSVGNDRKKDQIINSLKNINYFLQEIPDKETSQCGIGIYGRKRGLFAEIKASKYLSQEFINQNLEAIKQHDALLIEAYFIQEKPDLVKRLVEEFYRTNKYIIISLCDPFNEGHKNDIIQIAKFSNMIFGNWRAKSEFNLEQIDYPKDVWFIETVGRQGVNCYKFNHPEKKLNFVRTSNPQNTRTSEIIDKNGAFDAFLGGFLSQQIQGNDLDQCCLNGNYAACQVLKNIGCSLNLI